MALNLDKHLKKKADAIEVIQHAFCDRLVRDKDRFDLQERLRRLTKVVESIENIINIDEPKEVQVGFIMQMLFSDTHCRRCVAQEFGRFTN